MAYLVNSGKALLIGGRLLLALAAAAQPGGGNPPVGDGSVVLTLNEPGLDRRLYQQEGGDAEIPVEGTTSGTATVQARAVDAVTGATVTDWTDIPTSGGAFAGTLVCPERIPLTRLEVRDKVNTASVKAATKRFLVGDYLIWGGQSNCAEMPIGGSGRPISGVGSYDFIGGLYKRLGRYSTTETFPANTLSSTYGTHASLTAEDGGRLGDGYVYLANVLSARLGRAVCLIECSVRGQPITTWDVGNVGWTNIVNAVAAVGGKVAGMLWYQGEQDAANNTSYSTYLLKLASLHSRVAALVGRTAAEFKFGLVVLGATAADGGYALNMSGIRAAQVYYANNTPGAFLAASNHDCRTTDSIHVHPSSYAHLGPVLGCSVAAQFDGGPSGAGPRTVGGVRTGAALDFTIQHAGGTLLKDGGGGTGTALTGFRVYLASDTQKTTPLTIASTMITGASSYRLTLAANPGAPVVVDYGLMPAPHAADQINPRVDPVWASAIYDNVALVNNTRGCVMQPFASLAVSEA